MEAYAHSRQGSPPAEWHRLERHLLDTAEKARSFAEPFGAADAAYLAGLWHDLGKYAADFQEYLRQDPEAPCGTRVDHSSAGAVLAGRSGAGIPIAFAIAGHHAGLADANDLALRLREKAPRLVAAREGSVPDAILSTPVPPLPPLLDQSKDPLALDLWTRFLFSALVDADFLDTEAFLRPESGSRRSGPFATLPELRASLDSFLDAKSAGARTENPGSVNEARARILEACREAADGSPGVFTLTVPTGGGKTYSSLSFAFRHAVRHGLRRVVVAVPYTTIIEQTVDAYRKALGEEAVIEHHSNLDPTRETVENRLATENWDAPLVVTTNVQLLESLFANRPSRCRKLHNLARSVIILDEVQVLPPGMLAPILDVLHRLVRDYGCTLLLCTATQPALTKRRGFDGLPEGREIAPDPAGLFSALRRVEYRIPSDLDARTPWEKIARRVAEERQALVVVHRRADARSLHGLMPDGTFHLSALMCPAHRRTVLHEIRARLSSRAECRVVSTQLVEAGVDLDFPVVWRAFAGLDSLAQAAGRANREGRLTDQNGRPIPGRLEAFLAPSDPPPGLLRRALEQARNAVVLLRRSGREPDFHDPELYQTYFRGLYDRLDLDLKKIQDRRERLHFKTVAREFEIVEDGHTDAVVVPYGEAEERLARLRHGESDRRTLRSLQPFTVSIPRRDFEALLQAGALEEVAGIIHAIAPSHRHLYGPVLGLGTGVPLEADPGSLVV